MHINCRAGQLRIRKPGFEPGVATYQLGDLGPVLNLSELLFDRSASKEFSRSLFIWVCISFSFLEDGHQLMIGLSLYSNKLKPVRFPPFVSGFVFGLGSALKIQSVFKSV